MSDLGLNDHHHTQAVNYMRFCRYKRVQRLKAVDHAFQDVKDSRLYEDTYTVDEVTDMLDGLLSVVRSDVESELLNASHTSALLTQQMMTQAEKWHLKLTTDVSQLENSELLEQIANFEENEISGVASNKRIKPRLEPINQSGSSDLLQLEIERLKAENARLSERAKTMEASVTSCMSDNAKLKNEIKGLNANAGSPVAMVNTDAKDMEEKMKNLQFELNSNVEHERSQKNDLSQNLTEAKHELLRVKEQLDLAEKELDRKFKETAAYRNLREMLAKKNMQIKELRQSLSKDNGR